MDNIFIKLFSVKFREHLPVFLYLFVGYLQKDTVVLILPLAKIKMT